MSEQNKAIVRRLFDAFNAGRFDDAVSLLGSDYVWRGPGAEARGRDGWKQVAKTYRDAYPDLTMTIDEQIADGDVVVTRFTARGTHRGALAGVAASGRAVTVPCVVMTRIVNGRIAEDREYFDQLGMFQQIGMLPSLNAVTV